MGLQTGNQTTDHKADTLINEFLTKQHTKT
jgi:hypothetical protein